jgi:hypothetical protein
MKKWITPLLTLAALIFVAGCGSSAEIISKGLRISLTQITRSAEGSYAVSWQVENPNVVHYVVDRSEHKIYLDDVLVGTVAKKSRQGVPMQNKAEGVDPLTPNGPAAIEKLTQAIAQGQATYRVESTIWVLLADDETSKSNLVSTGTVALSAK